jgi:hypothetical protein
MHPGDQVVVALIRLAGYEDVHAELLAEDAMDSAWQWARLRTEALTSCWASTDRRTTSELRPKLLPKRRSGPRGRGGTSCAREVAQTKRRSKARCSFATPSSLRPKLGKRQRLQLQKAPGAAAGRAAARIVSPPLLIHLVTRARRFTASANPSHATCQVGGRHAQLQFSSGLRTMGSGVDRIAGSLGHPGPCERPLGRIALRAQHRAVNSGAQNERPNRR